MRKAILCFIRKDEEVLLIYDEYPTGAVWNGVSGYIEGEETPEEACVREVKEEIGLDIDPSDLTHLGTHDIFEIFDTYKFSGTPTPIERGITDVKWFKIDNLPYDKMHKGNSNWLPKFLNL